MSEGFRNQRQWPDDLEKRLFINRPHAVEQYRSRARIPPHYDFDRSEEDLRRAICIELRTGELLYHPKYTSNKDKEFLIRIETPGFNTVYALIEEGDPEKGNYAALCHTVFDQEMYMQWNHDGKLGTLGEIARGELPKLNPMITKKQKEPKKENYLITYKSTQGVIEQRVVEDQHLNDTISELLQEGVSFATIHVYKPVTFKLNITLETA